MERQTGVRGMKERWGCLGLVILAFGLSLSFPVFVHGEEIYNEVPEEPLPPPPGGVQLGFDPNDYTFLVYDGEGLPGQNLVQQAMDKIGIRNYTKPVRSPSNPVTLNDLSTHKILIVGWTSSGSMSGLHPDVLASGITGRVVLTGHDADFHTANNLSAATTFFTQAIGYVLSARVRD